MNDPWDVKSVRQPGQYLSCMKINGIPLLPPILSKECRKEMQYYRLLAKEVEKRISVLKQYVYENSSDSEDKTDAPELPECEQNYEQEDEEISAAFNVNIGGVKAITRSAEVSSRQCKNLAYKVGARNRSPSPKFFIDLNLTINETDTQILNTLPKTESPPSLEVPERDYNCVKRITQEVITEKEIYTKVETSRNIEKNRIDNDFEICDNRDGSSSDPLTEIPLSPDGPSSLSIKRFTGSLNNLHSESTKDSDADNSKLVRQRSYTLLYPSPQLLAHLEIHAQNNGIDVSSISMSESLSNISSPNKKRRVWDLESAKVKWSNMALELKQKSVTQIISTGNKSVTKTTPKQASSQRVTSVDTASARCSNPVSKVTPKTPKSEPITKNKFMRTTKNHRNSRSLDHQKSPHKSNVEHPMNQQIATTSEMPDPATRVRELYEKIQKQQLVQMENLVEKQRKEQLLLQKVFEEQNDMLFKQLKTICPKSPIEAKEAWSDKQCEEDRGPVSLSQLINYQSPTLTDTYLNQCDNVLNKSRIITGSLKKVPATTHSKNGNKIPTPPPKIQSDGSKTRTHSPVRNTTSRRLNYDTSGSSDRDYEPMLTDRTNDTMADLNVTFPSDSDGANNINSFPNQLPGKSTKSTPGNSIQTNSAVHSRTTEKTIKSVGRSAPGSIPNSSSSRSSKLASYKRVPNPKEREAATKIVAHAKGFLVRRLMRTERVQGIVQTIKDALLCALQLHQDREGIRGADVDLHRRLIQQITAACYALHDTFVTSSAAERCGMISADRGRRHSLAARQPISYRQTDVMTQSHSGSFPACNQRQPSSLMTQSNYETFSGEKSSPVSGRYVPSLRRRPWR